MNAKLREQLEAVIESIVEEDTETAKSAFHQYLRLKSPQILLGEKADEDCDDDMKDDKSDDKEDKKDDKEDKKEDDKSDDKEDKKPAFLKDKKDSKED